MAEPVQSCSTPAMPSPAAPCDCGPETDASFRYAEVVAGLLRDATESRRLQALAYVLASTIARIAVGCGAAATGDILSRIGEHMISLETRSQAERELEQERKEGRQPH